MSTKVSVPTSFGLVNVEINADGVVTITGAQKAHIFFRLEKDNGRLRVAHHKPTEEDNAWATVELNGLSGNAVQIEMHAADYFPQLRHASLMMGNNIKNRSQVEVLAASPDPKEELVTLFTTEQTPQPAKASS